MARTYVATLDNKEVATAESIMKMSQFFGYIMGYLDSRTEKRNSEPQYAECTKKAPKVIVLRTAQSIETGKIDRSIPVRSTVGIALALACDDRWWER